MIGEPQGASRGFVFIHPRLALIIHGMGINGGMLS